jgi:predicted nucleic acid-binding protein
MRFLVDANVLSEATRPNPNSQVLDWLDSHEEDLAVNPIILGEIEYGILRLPEGARRNRLLEWFQSGVRTIHVFVFDEATASTWARLLAQLCNNGRTMPVKDSMIAASALTHNLTVVTRNTPDFIAAGLPILNPFL